MNPFCPEAITIIHRAALVPLPKSSLQNIVVMRDGHRFATIFLSSLFANNLKTFLFPTSQFLDICPSCVLM
jgi:hypothetical protein